MGCFLGCFGSSKDDNKRHKNPPIPSYPYRDVRNQYNPVYSTPTPTVFANPETIKKPIINLSLPESWVEVVQEEKEQPSLINEIKPEEQLSSGTRKKVTFASNVKDYEHIPFHEPPEILQETEKGGEKKIDENSTKSTNTKSSSVSEGGSTLSSLGSFPSNHRYQNCRESDDEDEELDCEVSDLDEDEDDEEEIYGSEYSDDEFSTRPCLSVESRTENSATCLDAHNDHMQNHGSSGRETKTPVVFNRGARDRAGYVHSVLNPVENTAQWKAVKVKGTPPTKRQKENFLMDLGFQQSSTKSKSKSDEPINNHEIAVDSSLSAWLVASQKTPPSKAVPPISLEPISSGLSTSSHGSNSVRSQEERPILGALTVEELKQYSATSSPRRSPNRSPDERPLVGTVGVHWNDKSPVQDSGSLSSLKGIPNTTSKYREDKIVNWHSTPFETRLERALNKDASEGHASRRVCL